MRTLKRGCRGNDVRHLQYKLGINADGSFGPATVTAVKNKQRSLGLSVDGSVGPATQRAMGLSDFIVHIYDPKKDRIWFAGTPYGSPAYPTKTLKQWAAEQKADYVYNLAFFNLSGSGHDQFGPIRGRTLTYVRGNGKDIGYGGTTDKITIDNGNICGGYKLASVNGKRKFVSMVGKRARNANGILTDGRYFHIQSVTTNTEYEIVQHMLKHYRVKLMLIQDSGGSTGYYDKARNVLLAGEKEGSNGRSVATVVCVKKGGKI